MINNSLSSPAMDKKVEAVVKETRSVRSQYRSMGWVTITAVLGLIVVAILAIYIIKVEIHRSYQKVYVMNGRSAFEVSYQKSYKTKNEDVEGLIYDFLNQIMAFGSDTYKERLKRGLKLASTEVGASIVNQYEKGDVYNKLIENQMFIEITDLEVDQVKKTKAGNYQARAKFVQTMSYLEGKEFKKQKTPFTTFIEITETGVRSKINARGLIITSFKVIDKKNK